MWYSSPLMASLLPNIYVSGAKITAGISVPRPTADSSLYVIKLATPSMEIFPV
jgi:hypothetical protein